MSLFAVVAYGMWLTCTQQYARCRAQLADAKKKQKLLELQLEHSLFYGTLSAEQLAQSMSDMSAVTDKLRAEQPLPVRNFLLLSHNRVL